MSSRLTVVCSGKVNKNGEVGTGVKAPVEQSVTVKLLSAKLIDSTQPLLYGKEIASPTDKVRTSKFNISQTTVLLGTETV